jgi:hypothetical protein
MRRAFMLRAASRDRPTVSIQLSSHGDPLALDER